MWTNGIQASCWYNTSSNVTASPTCYFNYLAATTPNVSLVFPSRGIVADDLLTIVGAGFDAAPAANIVEIGGSRCVVVNSNATTLQCSMPNLPAGMYGVSVLVTSGAGVARINPDASSVIVVASVHTVWPVWVDACGGDVITLTGTGFGNHSDVQVRTVLAGGVGACIIL